MSGSNFTVAGDYNYKGYGGTINSYNTGTHKYGIIFYGYKTDQNMAVGGFSISGNGVKNVITLYQNTGAYYNSGIENNAYGAVVECNPNSTLSINIGSTYQIGVLRLVWIN